MKKLCITTFYGSENYGSNLQAVGLSEFFKSAGYEVFFLSAFKNLPFILKHPMLFYAKAINKINKKKYMAFFIPETYAISTEREQRLKDFRDEHFCTLDYKDSREWKEAIRNKTIFVAGSDIIWNPAKGYPATFFLDFAYYAKLPRFSYGTSVGAKKLPTQYYRAYRRYLGSMLGVGVREQSVADELEQIIDRKVNTVVDPSLLLTRSEWDKFAEKAQIPDLESTDYVLCYFVMNDSRYWDYVKHIREQTGMEIVVLPMHKEDEDKPYTIITDGTPYEFIKLIKDASFVCTDSFHACIVSMIYEKDFYLLRRKRKAEDAKYKNLLSRYQLMDRVVKDETKFIEKPQTDYSRARLILEADRERSIAYLNSVLQKCN